MSGGLGKALGTVAGGVGGFVLSGGNPMGAMMGASLGGSLLGGSGGAQQSGTTTVTNNTAPWSGVQPYLLGTSQKNSDGTTTKTPGLYDDAQKLYQGGQWSPQMQGLLDQQYQAIAQRTPVQTQLAQQYSNDLFGGKYDPSYSKVNPISQTSQAQMNWAQLADPVSAQSVDPIQAFSSMGAANPTGSISQMLSGQVNTSALDPVVQNAMRRLSDNFNEQVMPGINQGAVAAGQYGGSRQGIAQGLAAKGLALSQGDMAANLYNNAFNTAQSNMYGTANNMANLGLSNAQQNANRDLNAQQFNNSQANDMSRFNAGQSNNMQQFNAGQNNNMQQFNANLGLQNNTQAMNYANALSSNRVQGLSALQMANSLNDNAYAQQLGLLQAPNGYNWQNLGQYNSVLTGGAQLGGTKTMSEPYYTNPLGNALGLGTSALGLYNAGQKSGLWGGNATSGNATSSTGNMSGFYTDPWGASSGGSLGSGTYGIWR